MIDYEIAFKSITVAGILSGIFYRLVWQPMLKKQRDDIETALTAQRNEFQAGYFDVQEARYDRLLDNYIELEKRLIKLESKANP